MKPLTEEQRDELERLEIRLAKAETGEECAEICKAFQALLTEEQHAALLAEDERGIAGEAA